MKPAEAIEGVRGVHILRDVDAECLWDGTIVAVVAADRPEIAEDGVRAIEVGVRRPPVLRR